MRTKWSVVVLLLVMLASVAPLFAQTTITGSIEGKVTNDKGGPLEAVTVIVTSPALIKGQASTITDASGSYRFPALPPGTYAIEAQFPGYQNLKQEGARVRARIALAVNFVLPISEVKEEVTVTAAAPSISVVSNTVASSFGEHYIDNQPIPANYYNIIQMAPAVNYDYTLDLIQMKAIPDDTMMNTVEGSVKAIVCSHGHLDHIGAIPKLAHRYNAPIIGTPYTIELIRQQVAGEQKFGVNNKLFALKHGQKYTLSQHLTLEFGRMQHSIIDTATVVLHTPRGAVVYACDYKLDRTPVIGDAPDFARLRQIGKEGVIALITESTYIDNRGRAPSERIRPRCRP